MRRVHTATHTLCGALLHSAPAPSRSQFIRSSHRCSSAQHRRAAAAALQPRRHLSTASSPAPNAPTQEAAISTQAQADEVEADAPKRRDEDVQDEDDAAAAEVLGDAQGGEEEGIHSAGLRVVVDYPLVLPDTSPLEGLDDKWRDQLAYAPLKEALRIALQVGVSPDADVRAEWHLCGERLKDVALDETAAFFVAYLMSYIGYTDPQLCFQVVERLEARYNSTSLDPIPHPLAGQFGANGSFRSLVDTMPIAIKTKLLLCDVFPRETGLQEIKTAPPVKLPTWQTMDLVEMEDWEAKQPRVRRMRHVQVTSTPTAATRRLKSMLALQLREAIPGASIEKIAQIATIFWNSDRHYTGSLQEDTLELLSKRLLSIPCDLISPYVLTLTSSLRHASCPSAAPLWRHLADATLHPQSFDVHDQVLPFGFPIWPGMSAVPMMAVDQFGALKAASAMKTAAASRGMGRRGEWDEATLPSPFSDQEWKLHVYTKLLTNFCTAAHMPRSPDVFNVLSDHLSTALNETLHELPHDRIDPATLPIGLGEMADMADGVVQSGWYHPNILRGVEAITMRTLSKEADFEDLESADATLASLRGSPADLCRLFNAFAVYRYNQEVEVMGVLRRAIDPYVSSLKEHYRLMVGCHDRPTPTSGVAVHVVREEAPDGGATAAKL
ncbi:unnamed protein product [Vitrella brassicaformis CCMP3155]|uniref:Uncharacterized protein n=2 Tax=Vitrella brassicaformis TaxID=1169539 RepID=A0A0G4EXF9_VITBC|nr:unnamed protein product [Vitrella brassicaformis CCMP3155]|eukprot:CEM03264.1 unnamed protein product [Vitrella brassicaformis CCMP3155]